MPHQIPAEQASTLRTTVPDISSLFVMHEAVHDALPRMLHNPQLRWRIAVTDWSYLQRIRFSGQAPAQLTVDGQYTLFGTPVDLVNPDPGAWPQLVIINDRRN